MDDQANVGQPGAPPPVGAPADHPKARGRAGSSLGVVLIAVGVLLLAAQTLPGIRIWMLWPLFIIVPGAVQAVTRGSEGWSVYRFFDGMVTVALGAVLLGNTTGYLSWGVWWNLLELWPVLLISAGFGILGRSVGQEWLRAVGSIAVLAAIAYAVSTAAAGTPARLFSATGGEPFSFQETATGVTEARFKMAAGVGEVRLEPGSELIAIEGETPFSQPRFERSIAGSRASFLFALGDERNVVVIPGTSTSEVDVELSSEVLWDLEVDSGVSAFRADLSQVPVRTMELRTGVSSNRVVLGEVPAGVRQAQLTVDTGVSSVEVLVPREAHVRIDSRSGLTGHNISEGFDDVGGGVWETPGYEHVERSGAGVWTILVKSGVGSVTVKTY